MAHSTSVFLAFGLITFASGLTENTRNGICSNASSCSGVDSTSCLGATDCTTTSTYFPSPLESSWFELAVDLTRRGTVDGKLTSRWGEPRMWDDIGCGKVKEQAEAVAHWMEVKEARNHNASVDFDSSIFSRHVYDKVCRCEDGRTWTSQFEVPIEPLFSFLAHPEAMCLKPMKTHRASTEYLLPTWSSEASAQQSGTVGGPSSKFFFDLGGSIYNAGPAGRRSNNSGSLYDVEDEDELLKEVSQWWFMDQYAMRGIEFDRIFVWEKEIHQPEAIFGAMPDHIFDKTSYYNVPVSADINSKYSPLRLLKKLVKPEDFVVFKLDIDHPETEEAIVDTILNSGPEFCELIDEFWYEHHVILSPKMEYFKGFWDEQHMIKTLDQSYDDFVKLRKCGIRAHSWI